MKLKQEHSDEPKLSREPQKDELPQELHEVLSKRNRRRLSRKELKKAVRLVGVPQ